MFVLLVLAFFISSQSALAAQDSTATSLKPLDKRFQNRVMDGGVMKDHPKGRKSCCSDRRCKNGGPSDWVILKEGSDANLISAGVMAPNKPPTLPPTIPLVAPVASSQLVPGAPGVLVLSPEMGASTNVTRVTVHTDNNTKDTSKPLVNVYPNATNSNARKKKDTKKRSLKRIIKEHSRRNYKY